MLEEPEVHINGANKEEKKLRKKHLRSGFFFFISQQRDDSISSSYGWNVNTLETKKQLRWKIP